MERPLVKNDLIQRFSEDYPDEPMNQDTKRILDNFVSYHVVEDGDSATGWLICHADATDEEIRSVARMIGLEIDGRRCQHEYDCCGHIYSHPLRIEDTVSSNFRYAYQHFYRNV